MGLGGNLMWTAVFREIWKKHNNPKLKIIPTKKSKICKNNLWINNPYITYDINYQPHIKVDIKKTRGHGTIKRKHKNYDEYYDDYHIIINRCKAHNVNNPVLKCDLFFTDSEIKKVDNILKTLPKKFICIEPHAKGTYTKNKFYPFNKWTIIRESIIEYPIVQVGVKGKKILKNVIDITGKLTVRETAYLLKHALLYIGIEGGLGHCCNSVDTNAILIVPPMFHLNLIKYPNTICLWLGTEKHSRCGMRSKCDSCHEIINNHNETEVISLVKTAIKNI